MPSPPLFLAIPYSWNGENSTLIDINNSFFMKNEENEKIIHFTCTNNQCTWYWKATSKKRHISFEGVKSREEHGCVEYFVFFTLVRRAQFFRLAHTHTHPLTPKEESKKKKCDKFPSDSIIDIICCFYSICKRCTGCPECVCRVTNSLKTPDWQTISTQVHTELSTGHTLKGSNAEWKMVKKKKIIINNNKKIVKSSAAKVRLKINLPHVVDRENYGVEWKKLRRWDGCSSELAFGRGVDS
jgi:hypothetical protein